MRRAKKLVVGKSNNGAVQFFRYLFVGGGSAVVDIGLVYIFAYPLHIHYLLAVALAFLIATLTNYIGSTLWIFDSSGNIKKELTIFTIIGAGGLILNETIIWFLHSELHVAVIVAKLVSTAIVTFWSFGLRKILVFDAARRAPKAEALT